MAQKKKDTDSVVLGAATAASIGTNTAKYNNGYSPSKNVLFSESKKKAAESAVANYGDFSYGKQSAYDQAMNALLNREGFSYDLNGDALYQQYKDNYITQGKQAMMDAAGQAAAMTGGYGNSYAQTVGQQTYQGYLQGLNDKVPELYQMALNRYNNDGDRLATNYGLLASDRANALAEYDSGYNKLVSDRDYYAQKEQDAIANDMAIQQLNESIRANAESERLAREQLDYAKKQPATVDYAITNYSDIPSSIIEKLDGIVAKKINYLSASYGGNWLGTGKKEKVSDVSNEQKDAMKEEVSTYISGLVNSQQMSPALADALMEEYMALIDKKK